MRCCPSWHLKRLRHNSTYLLKAEASALATSSRHNTDTDARLKYLAWRLWHLKRKKYKIVLARSAQNAQSGGRGAGNVVSALRR